MAGRNKQPASVLRHKGSHMGRDNLDKREAEEVKVPDMKIVPPAYIEGAQLKKFNEIAGMLRKVDKKLFTALDVETLARYVVSHDLWLRYTNMLLETDDVDKSKAISLLQDKAFRQAHTSASALCLNITSRCKVSLKGDGDGGGNGESEF